MMEEDEGTCVKDKLSIKSRICVDILEKLGLDTSISAGMRNWNRTRNECCEAFEFINYGNDISYDEFFRSFLMPNKPCLFGKHVTKKWRSIHEWVLPDGSPNFDFLEKEFGSSTVPVANCGKVQFYAQPKEDEKFSDYLAYWKKHIEMGHNSPEGCLYLKDWHFTKAFPEYQAYQTPVFFTSDWLNEFWDSRSDSSDDYRFVYMGPKNSWTPFHADVFRSYSWSANICGRKRWLFYPPGEEVHLRDSLGNLAYDATSPDLDDPQKYPHRHRARAPLEVIQEAGQVIFVPSGWHHQVFNLEDTISINHNWLNGCNIDRTWQFLQEELVTVQRSIEDCLGMDGWDEQCQLIMKASTGMDYAEFFNFLHIIASPRLQQLAKRSQSDEPRDLPTADASTGENPHIPEPIIRGTPHIPEPSKRETPHIPECSSLQRMDNWTDGEYTGQKLEEPSSSSGDKESTITESDHAPVPSSRALEEKEISTVLTNVGDVGKGKHVENIHIESELECNSLKHDNKSNVHCDGTNSGPILTTAETGLLSKDHFFFDLWRIEQVLKDMMNCKEFLGVDEKKLLQNPQDLLNELSMVLND